ncbi:hypothetical protein [Variovorax sp. RA8]|uniref:hypothetical protein n=1 Tax=Variovorax sp. (strain JCM 16519 / RA8) TaxID=662548 RepID=UPI0013191A62|nr:hypothetical protein [Variovorax sp. RA8]VTU42299.1 hypothetical protein RA8P1_00200 [Variovorax sp. RA8]
MTSIPPFNPGPMFRRAYAADPAAQCAWRLVNEDGFFQEMAEATRNGRPALEPGQARLARALPELQADDETARHLKRMIGRMARQVMEREGFVFEPGSVPISEPILFLTAAPYRPRT